MDRSVLEGGSDGERAGESGGRRNTSRWTTFSASIERCTRRTRWGAGTAQTIASFCTCGRLPYLRPQPTGGAAGDGEHITRFLTRQLKRKVNESKSAVARPVERKFCWDSASATRRNPSGEFRRRPCCAASKRSRELTRRTTRNQSGTDDEGTCRLFTRLEELLRLLSDAFATQKL